MAHKVVAKIRRTSDGYRFRLLHGNNKIVMTGEAYASRANVVRAINNMARAIEEGGIGIEDEKEDPAIDK